MTDSMKRDIESCQYALCDDFEPFDRIIARLEELEADQLGALKQAYIRGHEDGEKSGKALQIAETAAHKMADAIEEHIAKIAEGSM